MPTTPRPEKTVRVRVAVIMNGRGDWNAEGWSDGNDTDLVGELRHTFIDCQRFDEHTTVRFIEAELPVLTAETVEGRLAD